MLDPEDEPELEVTLPSVCSMDVKTPRLESTKYRKATATNSTTQATSDMRKLNFITDHGSSREMTRSARRAGVWVALAWAPAAAGAPADAPERPLYRPRDTAENVEVRLRASSLTAAVGLSPAVAGLTDGLAWALLVVAVLDLPVLVLADPPADSVSEAGYGGTADVVSAGEPVS
jgi:hypothetical protein